MHRCCLYKYRLDRNTILGLKLLLFWYAGLSLGYFAACFCGGTLVSFLQQVTGVSGSAFGFLCASVFPLLFSACAVILISSRISCFLMLLRGIGIGFVASGIILCYGSAGWLMVLLLMFSSLFAGPVELWYLWRRLCAGMQRICLDTAVAAGICIWIGLIDFLIISPFVTDIFIL